MVSKTKSVDHNLALSEVLLEKMTPKINGSSQYSSSVMTTPRKKQMTKQYQNSKWLSYSNSIGNSQSPIGRSQENHIIKRQSPHNAHPLVQLQQMPFFVKYNTQRNSPSRGSPMAVYNNNNNNKLSPTMFSNGGAMAYAGAKFSEPPAANSLPKPPTHWMNSVEALNAVSSSLDFVWSGKCSVEISKQIKMLLNVQA